MASVDVDDTSGTAVVSSISDAPIIDYNTLAEYVMSVALNLLGGNADMLKAAIATASGNLNKFASEQQVDSLLIQRTVDDAADGANEEFWCIDLKASYSSPRTSNLMLVKRRPIMEAGKPLSAQLHAISVGSGPTAEVLHSIMRNAISPFISSFAARSLPKDSSSADHDGTGVSAVKKKVTELELSLLHLQQSVDIPEVVLTLHPVVQRTLERCVGRSITVDDFGDSLEDTSFINALQAGVGRWIRQLQRVTKLERDASSGTVFQEITFWLNLESSLQQIVEMLKGEGIQITLAILKHAKRFHATVSFDSDTGVQAALERVINYSVLLKDFPIDGLLSASETERLPEVLGDIFSHLKKIRLTNYPVDRAVKLVGAISRDLADRLLEIVSSRRLMWLDYAEFDRVLKSCFEVFHTWENLAPQFRDMARELLRKRGDVNVPIRIVPAHAPLQDRLNTITSFRQQHEQLRKVISRVLPTDSGIEYGNVGAANEIKEAYENIKVEDVLDLSKEGQNTWDTAVRRYNDRVDRVETQITVHLRDRLGSASNANEMLRVFSKFNALFVRPRIRGAIQEYQSQLIRRVKDDIRTLHDKFKGQYANSQDARMSAVRDIPPISGAIIWAKQIERQLATYMQRVEDVLGRGWEEHVEGQKLKADGDSFRKKLDTQTPFMNWIAEVEEKNLTVTGRIFDVFTVATSRLIGDSSTISGTLSLGVNFDPQIITLFKEVRNLQVLGFRVPYPIGLAAKHAHQYYPLSVSLRQSVQIYSHVLTMTREQPMLGLLLAAQHREVMRVLEEGIGMHWKSHRLNVYVPRTADIIQNFYEKAEDVSSIMSRLAVAIDSLHSCELSASAFSESLSEIQRLMDELSLLNCSNMTRWAADLDGQIEKALGERLGEALHTWLKALNSFDEVTVEHLSPKANADATVTAGIVPMTHEILIQNQVIGLWPPVEQARVTLFSCLKRWVDSICGVPRLVRSRYDVSTDAVSSLGNTDYRNLISGICQHGEALRACYGRVDVLVTELNAYVQNWLHYQALWDIEPAAVYDRLGDDLDAWRCLLVGIKRARTTFDTSESRRIFGPLIVEFGQVQSTVALKYDAWHKDILHKYSGYLKDSMHNFYAMVAQARTDLEKRSVDTDSTAATVDLITSVSNFKRQANSWARNVEVFVAGQAELERHRFQFPSEWLYSAQVQGEFGAFSDILQRKDAAMQVRMTALQEQIVTENSMVETKVIDLVSDWEKQRPVAGGLRPEAAATTLSIFDGRFERAKDELDNINRAKEALMLDLPSDDRLSIAMSELVDLRDVWSALGKVYSALEEIRSRPWASVVPRAIRGSLDELVNSMKALPNRMRQYASYEHVMDSLKGYLKVNVLVVELRSEALRERHWNKLMKRLRKQWHFSELTLGDVWGADLLRNDTIVKELITTAQGELALEQFLRQVRESWSAFALDLVDYQHKCRLIRGWDDLFTKLKENLNSLSAMRLSPYYKVFEDEASAWEEKLNRIYALFDVWIDVQRQWVYLDGIFSGSEDIKHLLPTETSRFRGVSSEFIAVMRKVAKAPLVTDVIALPNVQRQLERLADLLTKVQKALGEYLERERAAFPRFYFVGDEDLLEIIGNSKDILKLQKHFRKMFAGVHSLLLNEDASSIHGISSKEGEEISYKKSISLKDSPRINDWLASVESEMRLTLAHLLSSAFVTAREFFLSATKALNREDYIAWMDNLPSQVVVLAMQITWSQAVENALYSAKNQNSDGILTSVVATSEAMLSALADMVLSHQPPVRRRKLEHLITELVHQRDVVRQLSADGVGSSQSFDWLYQMRFYYDPSQTNVLEHLNIRMANSNFRYGFEYLGVTDKLVQTPLTDRCYLTMTQALEARLGGSPFGPAGTGKTETVKALGSQLGRFVLVFNCDDTFDFQAMGRIFVGLCQVGAWGCFDEFNRLEERMLSAVSETIQTIQLGLKAFGSAKEKTASKIEVDVIGKRVILNPDMAIFVTMNPGYAGRSNLPDNLKKLFRSMAMTTPDRQLIAQVMLFSQGFRAAEKLAKKIVPFFTLCLEQLSSQSHYDFGLRALKSVLTSAGNIKRQRIRMLKDALETRGEAIDESAIAHNFPEQEVLIQSVYETVVPKLVADDIPLLESLLSDVFPGIEHKAVDMSALRNAVEEVCASRDYVPESSWIDKLFQLYQIQCLHHGVMMVGPSGSGKSSTWSVLLAALEMLEGVIGVSYVIDPKAMGKDLLYGSLDNTTREWTDGLFTLILRRIIDNVRGESEKRHWIVFDGDVDPEWVENLNSVLDDNRMLTLPNGERLALPHNVRIMFEVQDLRFATLATVSRCGMVWFSEQVLSSNSMFQWYLARLRHYPLDESEMGEPTKRVTIDDTTPTMIVQRDAADILSSHLASDGIVLKALNYAMKHLISHVMEFTMLRALNSLFSMLNQSVSNILTYNMSHLDFPMSADQIERYLEKRLIYSLVWCFAGDAPSKARYNLCEFIRGVSTIELPVASPDRHLIDYTINVATGEWSPWSAQVPSVSIETHQVGSPDVVIPTVDTIRHEDLLAGWLADHKPLILCGPPGSGKTMTLFSALRALPDMEVVGLNFSSATTPNLLLKTFDHYCEYRRSPSGVVMAPAQLGKWLVFFCDEINLPNEDAYGTVRVVSFLRQIVEYGGFWRSSDHAWVTLERIQFVGACNPPTDPGRKPISRRFLRHAPVILVDYPGPSSLLQIYGTLNNAMLKLVPALRGEAGALTAAMVEFFSRSQEKFTVDQQPHYVYSPRELTRWVRAIHEAVRSADAFVLEDLVRLWAHEGLRLFQDRLIDAPSRQWTSENIDQVSTKHFPHADLGVALKRPIMYSNWITVNYQSVEREQLREFVRARLRVFYEEELDVPLVLFNEVLDHVLRIDRVFKQVQGHLLLIGTSGAGKTTLTRFVAWMNGLSIFQIKVHNKYHMEDFDEDLRTVLKRAGCKGEKIAFIMDESNVLDSGFLERINTLLANGEVPGLFEGDEYGTLMTACKEGSAREGFMADSSDELYKWFTNQVMTNLHVVFTMNPNSDGLRDRASTSPALFNRCVLDWFGNWSDHALFQVGLEFTKKLDLDVASYIAPDYFPSALPELSITPTHRDAVVNTFVFVHQSLHEASRRVLRQEGLSMAITPRHYLDFINHYVNLFTEKRSELEEQQLHLNVGLKKIQETVTQVEDMQNQLSKQGDLLETKNALANQKLQQMVQDQQEAETKKATSLEIQAALDEQELQIGEKKAIVMVDLARVEPAVIDAQMAVKGIKKQQLVEVRSMGNPPKMAKMALEGVATLLGHGVEAQEWKTLRAIIVRDDFISSIVNFNTENIEPVIRERMQRDYLANPDNTYEKVDRASKACGPLFKWLAAQVQYADMLQKVEPLRMTLQSLESAAQETREKGTHINDMITELERSISRYKEEYAVLIADVQTMKSQMQAIKTKCERSTALLSSLSQERERWDSECENFQIQMGTLVGDCLLSAAFLAYSGYFNQQYRQTLMRCWKSQLDMSGIAFKPDLALTEYLSSPDERARWQANSLPADELAIENAIMLKRFIRYPLIIDPSGQAEVFLMKENSSRKMSLTSFLDDAFLKNLESALRFGSPLLVQDVENIDPILNPVLNREVRRSGGRVLVRLGDNDVDLSPAFGVYLSTRDSSAEFAPDLCSRVTFVNFTVTPASLQNQCLDRMLKAERPDVDRKRSDLLKLQGEFRLRLRQLEKLLLDALNNSKTSILEDDNLISTLENLKREAAEVAQKSAETDIVMEEIEKVSREYRPIALHCSAIYFILENLHQLHPLYQYSLSTFLAIFQSALVNNPRLKGISDTNKRLSVLTASLFEETYYRISSGLLHQDRAVLAMLLSSARLRGSPDELVQSEVDYLLHGSTSAILPLVTNDVSIGAMNASCINRLHSLQSALPTAFGGLMEHVKADADGAWTSFMSAKQSEFVVPKCWNETPIATSVQLSFRELLVVQAARPDLLLAVADIFVTNVFGRSLSNSTAEVDLGGIITSEITSSQPILLCSALGHDASGLVEDLAVRNSKKCCSIAIGSAEGFGEAEKAITTGAKSGTWVLLKNVHLATSWLTHIEKRLHSLTFHANFRLFMSLEINPKIPASLLRLARILVFEPPPGLKANLHHTLALVPTDRMERGPRERSRLYVLTAWLHAVLQERLRYVPLGWSKHYEFNESDLRCALDTVDVWVDRVAQGRENISPELIPWAALRSLFGQSVYGGKVDNVFDQRLLASFLDHLFQPESFNADFVLTADIKLPDGSKRDIFVKWVEELSDMQTPTWLGLPGNADDVLLEIRGHALTAQVLKLVALTDNDDNEFAFSNDDVKTTRERYNSLDNSGTPVRMASLIGTIDRWLAALRKPFEEMRRTVDKIKDPLFRCFEREVRKGLDILNCVTGDLLALRAACAGETKQTNYVRSLIDDIVNGVIPRTWNRYSVPGGLPVAQWIGDLAMRLNQLMVISTASDLKGIQVWLGGLFLPDAFITATRQYVAQEHGWSLEELELKITVGVDHDSKPDKASFHVIGLQLEGAKCRGDVLELPTSGSSVVSALPLTCITWVHIDTTSKSIPGIITLPIYLNNSRAELLFTVKLRTIDDSDGRIACQRGIGLFCSSLVGL